MQILKYHGSYMQSNREAPRGSGKDFQFMLRLKQPAGELPADLYRLLDDLSREMGVHLADLHRSPAGLGRAGVLLTPANPSSTTK